MKEHKLFFLSVSLASAIVSTTTVALPDSRQGNPLDSLGITTPEGVGDIIRDHEKANTLYVGPANVKNINGTYAELDSSGPMCVDFINIRRQAYLTPVTPAQKEAAYNNREYVSNYYQVSYSVPRSNIDGLNAIKKARDDVRHAGEENAQMLAEYYALNTEWNELIAQLTALEAQQSALDTKNNLEVAQCITKYASNTTMLVSCLSDNTNWYNAEKLKIDTAKAPLATRKAEVSHPYYKAKGRYDALMEELQLIQDDVAFHTQIITAQMKLSSDAWNIEKAVLKEEEGKVVGRASAGYNLFDNETTLLAQALRSAGHGYFQTKQLDVFNVSLNSGVTVDNPLVAVDDSPLFSKNTWSFPADTLLKSSLTSEWSMTFEREERGDTIYFDAMDKQSFASGGLNFYITKGARCGEYTQEVEEEYSATNGSGIETSWRVRNRLYEPQPDRVVFSQDLGLTYNYYAYPGPIEGECSIEVDRMSNYWRNKGRKSSWSWFRKKTNTWDHTRQTSRDDMGFECNLTVKPITNDPKESAALAEEFERSMYQQMWEQFLAIYAKEYKVEVIEPDIVDPGKSTAGNTLGNGLMKICGVNVYCQFSGIVLKTLDELGGSKATGTTSATNSHYGKITKHFSKDTWAVKQGSSLVKVKVCVDHNQCS